MTGTDAMDVYLTGGVDRSATSGARITSAVATTYATTYLHNHQNSHHELAPQQKSTWCRGGKKSEKNVARVVVALLGACGPRVEQNNACVGPAPFAQSAVRENLHVQPRRPCSRWKEITVTPRRRKSKLPSLPAEGKNVYRPVPPRKTIRIVPPRWRRK